MDFTLDTAQLDRALRLSPAAAGRGAATALKDIKNDWVAEAIDAAPVDTANLRRQIAGEVINPGTSGLIEVHANATRGQSRFNYAYYIHEDAGRAVSGEKKFLDKPAEANEAKWQRWLEEELEKELRRAGF